MSLSLEAEATHVKDDAPDAHHNPLSFPCSRSFLYLAGLVGFSANLTPPIIHQPSFGDDPPVAGLAGLPLPGHGLTAVM